MIRVLTIFGTRPEAVKLAPVVQALAAHRGFDSIVGVTGQHRDLLNQVLRTFGIVPTLDLDVMRAGQAPVEVVARILGQLPAILRRLRPQVVLVQGDTMTAFAAALAAHLERIPVAHVEAGLRTGNRHQPFPEETNRVLTARLATLHFAPTEPARAALLAEGTPPDDVYVTGNTIVDALRQTIVPARRRQTAALAGLDPSRPLVLVTAHRRESFGAPLRRVCAALRRMTDAFPRLTIIFPVHPNPMVQRTVTAELAGHPAIRLTGPLQYLEFLHVLNRAQLVLTDSGGVQEEATTLGKPLLVLRDTTERHEGIAAGAAILVGTDADRIVAAARRMLQSPERARLDTGCHLYGDGRAAPRIVSILARRFGAPRARPAGAAPPPPDRRPLRPAQRQRLATRAS